MRSEEAFTDGDFNQISPETIEGPGPGSDDSFDQTQEMDFNQEISW